MKRFLISILLVLAYVSIYGQDDTIYIPPIDFDSPPIYCASETDLMDNLFWKNYLLPFGKKSICNDSTILEAYRLLYWGKYFAIVELLKRDSIFLLTVDSSDWKDMTNGITHRKQDTLYLSNDLLMLRKNCEKIKFIEKKPIMPEPWSSFDDRDNWALEYKNDNFYRTIKGIEVHEDFKHIIIILMKFGKLSGYKIH